MNKLSLHKKKSNVENKDSLNRTFLAFAIAGTEYALPIQSIREIINYSDCTHIPKSPDFVHGLIHLRGESISVLDLNQLFNDSKTILSQRLSIIIVENVMSANIKKEFGILVEHVRDVIQVNNSQIEKISQINLCEENEYITEVIRHTNEYILVINQSRLNRITQKLSVTL